MTKPSHAKVAYWIDEHRVHQSTAYLTSEWCIDTEPGDLVHGVNKHSGEALLLRVSDPLGGDHPYQLTQVRAVSPAEAIQLLTRIDELTTEWEYSVRYGVGKNAGTVASREDAVAIAAQIGDAQIMRRRARRDPGEWQEDPSE